MLQYAGMQFFMASAYTDSMEDTQFNNKLYRPKSVNWNNKLYSKCCTFRITQASFSALCCFRPKGPHISRYRQDTDLIAQVIYIGQAPG